MDPRQLVTLVLGASPNPGRYSYEAVVCLLSRNIPVIAVGKKEFSIGNFKVQKTIPSDIRDLHTISLYLNAVNQRDYYDSIISLAPKRIIFNPGTCNPELAEMAVCNGIEVVENCTVVMLRNGEY